MLNEEQLGDFIDRHFASTLFRLETLSQYNVSLDNQELDMYLAGDPEPHSEWTDVIRGEVARGLHTYRVHVVRSPLNAYLRYRFEWGHTSHSQAGEHVRVIDTAEQAIPDGVPAQDFWLIGDTQLVLMHYSSAGEFVGATVENDRLSEYIDARERAWNGARDFWDYWSAHPQYHRDRSAA